MTSPQKPAPFIHINDVAHVGSTLVFGLNEYGVRAEFYPIRIYFGHQPFGVKLFFLPLRILEWLKAIYHIRRGGYSVVHIHYATMGIIGLLSGGNYYIHCHGTDVRSGLESRLGRLLLIPILKKARRVFYSTPDLQRVVAVVRNDAIFLPNPVNTNIFVRDYHATQGKAQRLLLFSEIDHKNKGSNVALEALSEIHRRYPDLEIHAIGFGKDFAKYSSWDWICFLPFHAHSELPELLKRYDIIVGQFGYGMLTVSELEAMSCSKPVVCYFNFPEAYPEEPPVISCRMANQVVESISQLIEDPCLRQDLGSRARAWVDQYHEVHRICEKLLSVYQADLRQFPPSHTRVQP